MSDSVSVGSLDPGAHKVLFSPSEYLWQVWGLILNAIFSLLLLAGTSLLLLDVGYLLTVTPVLVHTSKVMLKILQATLQQYVN